MYGAPPQKNHDRRHARTPMAAVASKRARHCCCGSRLDKMEARPDVRARELLDEFFEKQDEPQYMRNVLSGLSSIMLVSVRWSNYFCGSSWTNKKVCWAKRAALASL